MNLALFLFLIGILGFILNRKNIILMIISIEIMLLAVTIIILISSFTFDDSIGQTFSIYIISIAGAESVIGLSIMVAWYRLFFYYIFFYCLSYSIYIFCVSAKQIFNFIVNLHRQVLVFDYNSKNKNYFKKFKSSGRTLRSVKKISLIPSRNYSTHYDTADSINISNICASLPYGCTHLNNVSVSNKLNPWFITGLFCIRQRRVLLSP
jgi:NADH-ubiquinone oxidoreductase chain 4L